MTQSNEELYILFMDDCPQRAALAYTRWPEDKKGRTIWCTTAEEAIGVLKDYPLDEVHLDHDLGGEQWVDSRREDCGMEVIRFIEKMDKKEREKKFSKTRFIVHSWNLPAGQRMTERLVGVELNAVQIPFGT